MKRPPTSPSEHGVAVSDHRDSTDIGPDQSRYAEPSEEIKRRNRWTGFIIASLILAMIAVAMIVRAYGS